MVSAIDGRVKIGAYNWIANRCTIQKGTVTPDDLVIASGSLLNKDYTVAIPPYSMIGGRPAKLLRENLARVWNPHAEEALRKAFGATGESRLEFIDLKLK
jgi:acetyltransferase-like isoleucine patch superfamily enzyme